MEKDTILRVSVMNNVGNYWCCYIDSFLGNITKDLDANRTRLLSCHPWEREEVKNEINVQVAVLEYLQGRRVHDLNLAQLWTELIPLREKLKASEEKEQLSENNLHASWKIINDLRHQLHESLIKERESVETAEKTIADLQAQKTELQFQADKMKGQFLTYAFKILSSEQEQQQMDASEMGEKLQAVQACMDLIDKLEERPSTRRAVSPRTTEGQGASEQILSSSSADSNSGPDTPTSEEKRDPSMEGAKRNHRKGDWLLQCFPFFQRAQRDHQSSQ